MAHSAGLIPNKNWIPCRTLVACLHQIPPSLPRQSSLMRIAAPTPHPVLSIDSPPASGYQMLLGRVEVRLRQLKDRATGGRLQPVLMRHPPPAICQNLWGGGGGGGGQLGGGGPAGGRGGGVLPLAYKDRGQASAVPRKNFLCCGMLRHAAACCGMLQPALVGTYASVSS